VTTHQCFFIAGARCRTGETPRKCCNRSVNRACKRHRNDAKKNCLRAGKKSCRRKLQGLG
jgi:hypothetical protein